MKRWCFKKPNGSHVIARLLYRKENMCALCLHDEKHLAYKDAPARHTLGKPNNPQFARTTQETRGESIAELRICVLPVSPASWLRIATALVLFNFDLVARFLAHTSDDFRAQSVKNKTGFSDSFSRSPLSLSFGFLASLYRDYTISGWFVAPSHSFHQSFITRHSFRL